MALNLSQKERYLLEDQKSHEEICIEKYTNYSNNTQDQQLKQIFNNLAQAEKTHLNSINQLLNGQVPQVNNQSGGQQSSSQNTQGNIGNQSTSGAGSAKVSDEKMCTDMLMTEKYVSGAYNTAIFEFRDTNARDVLNHIQKEEQQHGEQIFKYMENKGLYNVK